MGEVPADPSARAAAAGSGTVVLRHRLAARPASPVICREGVLRLARYLVGRACRHLPDDARSERYREWTAELCVRESRGRRAVRAMAARKRL